MADETLIGMVTDTEGRPVEIHATPGAVSLDLGRGTIAGMPAYRTFLDCKTARDLIERLQAAELTAWATGPGRG